MRRKPFAALLVVVVAAAGLLGACSDDSDSTAKGATTIAKGATTTTAKGATSTAKGATTSTAGVLPPLIIDGGGAKTARIGDNLDVVTAGVTEVSTDDPAVLEVSQPHSDGSATFNAGARVVGAGEAHLVVKGEGGTELYTVDITATGD